jgi:hypothetical protein
MVAKIENWLFFERLHSLAGGEERSWLAMNRWQEAGGFFILCWRGQCQGDCDKKRIEFYLIFGRFNLETSPALLLVQRRHVYEMNTEKPLTNRLDWQSL